MTPYPQVFGVQGFVKLYSSHLRWDHTYSWDSVWLQEFYISTEQHFANVIITTITTNNYHYVITASVILTISYGWQCFFKTYICTLSKRGSYDLKAWFFSSICWKVQIGKDKFWGPFPGRLNLLRRQNVCDGHTSI
jgi:hypothetical protein